MEFHKWNIDFLQKNKVECKSYIEKNYHLIPYLNVNGPEYINNSVVRFRGMVQDMHDPEYYLEKCEVLNTTTNTSYMKDGKYVDTIQCGENEILVTENINNVSSERQTFVVISVPSLNSWVHEIEDNKYKLKSSCASRSGNNKRPLDTTEETDTSTHSAANNSKKSCNSTNTENSHASLSKDHLLNLPIPEENGKTCHIRVYDNNDIKLNEVYDFVGFLSNEILPQNEDNEYFSNEMEIQTHNPPTSLIPRLHCISWSKVPYINPLLDTIDIKGDKIKLIKKELQLIFTEIMLGDDLAADYLLYHLLSKIYLRKELMSLGSFTLNISNIPVMAIEDYGEKIYNVIQSLVSKSHYLPMTLENMNNLTFTPKKDYVCSRLTSGLLQLSEGTNLILDETKLTPGKLNESGVKAVSAINNIIKGQKVAYDFKYYNMDFDCDIPILIISEGKSLLPSDGHVVLKPSDIHVNTFKEIYEAVNKLLNADLLNDIRVYLTTSRNQEYEITDNMLETVQNDFVKLRQRYNIDADDLHRLLVLSRLICISEGKTTLDKECWKMACDLEDSRKARLQ